MIFPTFGLPFGFALGVTDFVFLAFFALTAHRLRLYNLLTTAAGCAAVLAPCLPASTRAAHFPPSPLTPSPSSA